MKPNSLFRYFAVKTNSLIHHFTNSLIHFFTTLLISISLIHYFTISLPAGEPGTAGLNFLKISLGAKGIAMGESGTAIIDDIYAVYWNPAGLAKLQSPQTAFIYNFWFQEINSQWLAYGQPSGIGNFALSINYLGMKDFPGYDAGGGKTSSLGANDLAFALSYAKIFHKSATEDALSGGINLKYIQEKLEQATAGGLALDLGFLYNCGASEDLGEWAKGLSLGLAYQNLGQGIKFDQEITPFPQILRIGLGYTGTLADNQLNFALDFVSPLDNKPYFSLGSEYWLDKLFALRVGYRSGDTPVAGLRAGLGIKIPQEILSGLGDILFDYAWSGFAPLGDTHRFSLKIEFAQLEERGERESGLGESRLGNRIATYFKEAKDYQKKGSLLHTLDRYYRVLELAPGNKLAKSKVQEMQKILEDILEEKKYRSPKERYSIQGFIYYEQGKLAEAVNSWEKTLEVESRGEKLVLEDKITLEYLNKTKKMLTEGIKNRQIKNLLESGISHYQEKKYKQAEKIFSELLKLDPENQQAKEYLEKCELELEKIRKAKIVQPKEEKIVPPPPPPPDPVQVEKHYQQGLIYYASGQLESAMKEFETVLKLDPKHEKAQQALEKVKKELKQ